jgi:3-deoxy-manno-octulosonate cytidylyltransferase (CMP-KDO synthetase)
VNHTGANPATNAIAIIPARYESTRLPGKPLLPIAGKSLVLWVVERALAARHIDRAIVATDDERIFKVVTAAGYEAVMTSGSHASGTDRVAEVAQSLAADQIIVNVQGDEPLISPQTIDSAIEALANTADVDIATTCEPITNPADVTNSSVVKVVTDKNGCALYFSRSPIPFPEAPVRRHGSIEAALANEPKMLALFKKHTGLYVYRRDFLLKFASWPPSALEETERLEQLRALERGARIKVVAAASESIGVDTVEDLQRVRELIEIEEATIAK